MRSRRPKVLHEICGRAMILWPIVAATQAGADRVVVVDGPDRALAGYLPADVAVAVQEHARGTADAVRAAAEHVRADAPVLVLSGDVPLIEPALLLGLLEAHLAAGAAATITTLTLEDPGLYGRVVRGADGAIERIVETKVAGDASSSELAIREVNAGLYAFQGAALLDALQVIGADNAQGEYYLPDAIAVLHGAGAKVTAYETAHADALRGVNDRVELAAVRAIAQRRILEGHMRAGVTVVDPASTSVDVDVEIGMDTVIEPGCSMRGATRIGESCVIGPLTTVIDAVLGDEVTVAHSYLRACTVGDRASVGPFAYLRPDAILEERSKVGTFVEIKGSRIGPGAKVPHLSYIGDAEIGEGTNMGACTVTANYDGRHKHRTRIGAHVKGGVDTTFVAPVTVGDGAWTAAGSVVTEDVPEGALAIGRARQRNIDGYAERRAVAEGRAAAEGRPDGPATG